MKTPGMAEKGGHRASMTSETQRIVTDAVADTEAIGGRLARLLGGGTVVALHGPLGAGKTAFARGIARGLGITEPITSPTFTIAQEYQSPTGLWFYHLDMYRIRDESDALAFGVEEYLFSPGAVTVVEWPERITGLLVPAGPAGLIEIFLASAGVDRRCIRLPGHVAGMLAGGDIEARRC